MAFLEELRLQPQQVVDQIADHLEAHQKPHRLHGPRPERSDPDLDRHQSPETQGQNRHEIDVTALDRLVDRELQIERRGEHHHLQQHGQTQDLGQRQPQAVDPRPKVSQPGRHTRTLRLEIRRGCQLESYSRETLGHLVHPDDALAECRVVDHQPVAPQGL